MNIHPLQEKSVGLLKTLYFDKHVNVTKAIHSIIDGYYPSVESILGTLQHYQKEELVSEFMEENSDLIEVTKKEIKQTKNAESNNKDYDDDSSMGFGASIDSIYAYRSLKSIPLVDIEKSLSSELSKLCNDDLVVEINSVKQGEAVLDANAYMEIVIRPKNDFCF